MIVIQEKKARKLSRVELLELLIEESEKNERLERELKKVRDELASRELKIEKAGSLAEAALAISGVFEAVEDACAIYKQNLERCSIFRDVPPAEPRYEPAYRPGLFESLFGHFKRKDNRQQFQNQDYRYMYR